MTETISYMNRLPAGKDGDDAALRSPVRRGFHG